MRARAALAAELIGGRTVATTLRSAPPVTLRRTGATAGAGAPLAVHLVGSAAGPVGGDDLALEVTVGAGAALDVRSVAAALAYPGPSGRSSHLGVTAAAGAGAGLAWRPEPTVLVRGCDHRTSTRIAVAPDATLVWQEVVVLGRHAEPGGSLFQRLRVDVGGRPVLRNDLAVGPLWPASQGPAGVGDARAVGTAVLVNVAPADDVPTGSPAVRGATLALGGGAWLVSVLSTSAEAVTTALDGLTMPTARAAVPAAVS